MINTQTNLLEFLTPDGVIGCAHLNPDLLKSDFVSKDESQLNQFYLGLLELMVLCQFRLGAE